DGFMGALPDSQVKQFVDRLAAARGGGGGGDEVAELLAMAQESLELGDVGGAAQAFAQVLRADPENLKAIAGLARLYLQNGDAERAREVLQMAPEGAKDADLDGVKAALALAAEAGDSDTAGFQQRLAQNPADHEARLELAKALAARGNFAEAADHLLKIVEQDRE